MSGSTRHSLRAFLVARGGAGGRRLRYARWWGSAAAFVLGLCLFAGMVIVLAWPMDASRYLWVDSSGIMTDRSGALMAAALNRQEQWCFPRPLKEISPYLIQATIAVEDERFYVHPGVDPAAVVRATYQNVRRGRVVSGASTLTMQLVKRADKTPRSLAGKMREAVQALRLERRVDKNTLLEAYLNGVSYGLNLEGCEAASRRFFGKSARELTLPEAALLAGLPKAPTELMPLKHAPLARKRRDYVLQRMEAQGFISREARLRAAKAPLGTAWHDYPMLSRHLAMRLMPELAAGAAVQTTLDRDLQARAERLLARHLLRFSGDIGNGAMIVVDVPSASVLARVGAANFFETPGGGQVDACLARRSPGSALKPFTYALAIERNCLYSCETLLDDSLDYGMFNPENFDGNYAGLVSAAAALRRSLNVPAVLVSERVGLENVHAFLRSLGLTTLDRSAEHYGLGLALGNCEVRLEELAAAYCMLANLGEYRPLRTLVRDPVPTTRRMLSRGTCLEIYQMLEQTPPEEFDRALVPVGQVRPRLCWKTGTSTGYRDAWTIMFNRQYLVGVWLGNNDAKPSRFLIGARAALPLAQRMFRSLRPTNQPAWPEVGDDLRPVQICALSGLPAVPWCMRTRTASLPSHQYLNRTCDMHYPARKPAPEATDTGILERWPGGAMGWDLACVTSPKTRLLSGSRVTSKPSKALRIITPCNKAVYVLTGEPNGDKLRLQASIDDEAPLHWYVNDQYVGTSRPEAPVFLNLSLGAQRLACMTPEGVLDTVQFDVVPPGPTLSFRTP